MKEVILESWKVIAPSWPLKNIIAVNPLSGLEDLPFEEALDQGYRYFSSPKIPRTMEEVNLISIKWLQVFFDEGQSSISMPNREEGLFSSWKKLAKYDVKLKGIDELPSEPNELIALCLKDLAVNKKDYIIFLRLLLITLPGWASYVKYNVDYCAKQKFPVSLEDYLAFRIAIFHCLALSSKELIDWYHQIKPVESRIKEIEKNEKRFRAGLLKEIADKASYVSEKASAQFVFCIDVRSEPFRKNLESIGNYETFGFAGFFGIPVEIKDSISGESYDSCPVLLKPSHQVIESPRCCDKDIKKHKFSTAIKTFYQSLKYNFTTAFALVETIGAFSGLWMLIRTFVPSFVYKLKGYALLNNDKIQSLDNISLTHQIAFAESALKLMGLTKYFAPIVVFCGHGSASENNAFATSLDCGACGGHHGASNAKILASILNNLKVRQALAKKEIIIPDETVFVAAEHNTTSDEVKIFASEKKDELEQIVSDLDKARKLNSVFRCNKMNVNSDYKHTHRRSIDWSQTRPEWGLARNAAFIVGPRNLTKNINLDGRCFLHSYNYEGDEDGSCLKVILTAPMVVAELINMQYLFSTYNNISFGSGSKITKNITGKIAIMQGNASDLMTGLPLQSVNESDKMPYHELQRLMTLVYAPRKLIDKVIKGENILEKLFGNGWVSLFCIDPEDKKFYFLNRDLKWQSYC